MEAKRQHLAILPEKCSGCRLCELACSMEHYGVLNPDLARIRILRLKSPEINVPLICNACDDAPCIKVCPMNARQRDTNGTVVTDEERCIGCKACVYICPTGTPSINPYTHKSMTCDMCKGEKSAPWCAVACKSEGALRMVDVERLGAERAREQAQRLRSILPLRSPDRNRAI